MRQAVILAAGKSTRCYPLTLTRPKILLKVANKTLIEHNLEQLDGIVEEVVIVVGYKKEMIKRLIGNKYKKTKIKYVEQKQQLGTANALLQTKSLVKNNFIVLYGDDLYFKGDIKQCAKEGYALLAAKTTDPKRFGIISLKKGFVEKIIEKPKNTKNNLANCGVYFLDTSIFIIIKNLTKSKRDEYELTDAINEFAKKKRIRVVKAKQWLPNGYSWDLLDSNEFLLKNIKKNNIQGKVEKGATINEVVEIGKGTIVKAGTYIKGPVVIGENCSIGPNCYIRPYTSIGNNCKVGQAVEIKNTIIMDNSKVPHLSYVGDSIIGENVNIGAGTITANLRHDYSIISSMVNGKLKETSRKKFGTVIGDNSKTGIHTTIYPGRKIWPNKTTMPGEIIKKDVT